MTKDEFGQLLRQRDIPRHHSEADLAADLAYAHSQSYITLAQSCCLKPIVGLYLALLAAPPPTLARVAR